MEKGSIIKIAKGNIVEKSAKDLILIADNIKSTAKKLVNEKGENGISFR